MRSRGRRPTCHLEAPPKHPLRVRRHRVKRPHRGQRLGLNVNPSRHRRVHRDAQRTMILRRRIPRPRVLSRTLFGRHRAMNMAHLHRAHHHHQQQTHQCQQPHPSRSRRQQRSFESRAPRREPKGDLREESRPQPRRNAASCSVLYLSLHLKSVSCYLFSTDPCCRRTSQTHRARLKFCPAYG